MPKDSIFTDEWRRCLRAHYMDVIRRDDQITLKSLVRVMHDTGFNDDELAELRIRATIRADDMPDDFVPDARVFQAIADVTLAHDTLSPEESGAQDEFIEEIPADIPAVVEEEVTETVMEVITPVEDGTKKDPDAPEQLSLF